MTRRFKPVIMPYYPHLSVEDTPIWTRFLSRFADIYDAFDYDVRVGPGRLAPETFNKEDAALYRLLTQKRIDAVGHIAGDVHLFEIKPVADGLTLGQILTYRALFIATFPDERLTLTAVVCAHIDSDVIRIYAANDIELFQV